MERPPLAKRLKRFLRYLLIRGVMLLLQPLPLGVARALGARLGALAYTVAGGERRKALKSLAVAFPEQSDAQRQALAKAAFRHLGAAALEVACTGALDEGLERLVAWPEEDRRVLETALARGKGVVFV
ncbi:MAG TPA: lipid A biosynthesis acyltransferase, partial [Myxococcus sp.]|nr:lipid A biosynthesis acyltransferase [Myxococcus sp.]